MNLKEIKEIVTLMNENDLTEIEVEREGSKIKIRKGGGEVPVTTTLRPVAAQVISQPPPIGASEPPPSTTNKKTIEITAPMVGTFYRAPSPEAPPFVDVGQIIEVGQVVCILEAMKLMNEIKSEVRGKIVEIVVENAEPVEFGQTLFVLEPV